MSLRQQVIEAFQSGVPVLTPQGLLHLGSRSAIDQTLSRLTKEGVTFRIERGAYVHRRGSRFGKRLPSIPEVIAGLQQATGETIVPNGAAEANRLGLSTQVPVRQIFLTSGSARSIEVGQQVVLLQKGHAWEMIPGNVGSVVRALSTMSASEMESRAPEALHLLTSEERRELWNRRMQLPIRLLESLLPELAPEYSAA